MFFAFLLNFFFYSNDMLIMLSRMKIIVLNIFIRNNSHLKKKTSKNEALSLVISDFWTQLFVLQDYILNI